MKEVLDCYVSSPGVVAAMLVSDQGLLIAHTGTAGAGPTGVAPESLAALVVDTIVAAMDFGRSAKLGGLSTLLLDYEGMALMVAPVEKDVLLVLLAEPGSLSVGCSSGNRPARTSPLT